MANVLVVPVSTKADGWAVTQAVAGALPDSAVFRAFDEAGEAEKLVCAGKSDDWLDSLVTCVAALKAANVVIKGAKPDPERVLLSTKNLDVALSFDASVVFAMQTDTDDVEHVTNRLNLAKQAYIHSPGTAVGFVLDGGDAGAGAAIAEKTGLVYFGSSQKIINTDLLLKKPGGRMSPAQFRVNMMDAARKGNKRIVLPEGAEPRTVQAAAICHEKGIARCVLLAPRAEVEAVAKERHITLPDSLEIIDPADLIEKYVGPMCELRKSKGLTPDQAPLAEGWQTLSGDRQAFVTALAMVHGNSRQLGSEVALARPGDLMFFDQGDDQHLMIWMGNWIAYHTGQAAPVATGQTLEPSQDNGLRAVTLAQLLQWKDTRWRPREDNPNFAGFYRLAFLSR